MNRRQQKELSIILALFALLVAMGLIQLGKIEDADPLPRRATYTEGEPINMTAADCAPVDVRCGT